MERSKVVAFLFLISFSHHLRLTDAKVNCANYQPFGTSEGYTFISEIPSANGDNGHGYVVGDPGNPGTDSNSGHCLITIEDTTIANQQSDQKIPSSSCSAFAATAIGNYLLYGTAAPVKGIAAYALQHRHVYPLSDDMLFLPTDFYIKQIIVSQSTTEPRHGTSLVVTLNENALPSAFEILTSGDRFRLSPCISVFPHAHVSDIALLDRNKATIIVFANNNVDVKSEPKDRYAPIYISSYNHRNATLCGYVPVERTKNVELFLHGATIVATFVQSIPNGKRSFIRWFGITVTGKTCTVSPWGRPNVLGALPWETGFSVLPSGSPSTLFPFTVDNILCGVEDIKVVQTSTFTALIVAVSNPDTCMESSCTPEDMLTFEPNKANSIRICGCAYAIKTSFAILLNKNVQRFTLDVNKPLSFQTFKTGPEMTTEIQTLLLPCCVLVQLCSTSGKCELYTIRLDQRTNEFDVGSISGTRLPSLTQSSAVGSCRTNSVAVSYSGIEPSTRPVIHKFSCTNWNEGHTAPDENPRLHLALKNATGAHFPVSDSLPGNRWSPATPVFVNRQHMNSPEDSGLNFRSWMRDSDRLRGFYANASAQAAVRPKQFSGPPLQLDGQSDIPYYYPNNAAPHRYRRGQVYSSELDGRI